MANKDQGYILYHHLYSICSIMVRYTLALRGEAKDSEHRMNVEEEVINIWQGEQLTEHYLCDINACGEVPVIAPANSKDTIPDSMEITKYLAQFYPSLIPASHAGEITRLLFQLHGLNYFSLSYTGKPEMPKGVIGTLEKRLEHDISARYREAIKFKIKRMQQNKIGGLENDVVRENEQKAGELMKELEELVQNSQTGWCFGLKEPSALDAHLVVFIARMFDVKRGQLIPEGLKVYAQRAMDGAAWNEVMQGRNTFTPS